MSLVSIAIPSYNTGPLIIKTLNSVRDQSYNDIELIIIDDCSKDGTFELIKNWAEGKNWVKIFQNESNLGLVKTANKLIEKCRGEYIQLLGHDDILSKDKVEKQVQAFKGLPADVGMLYSNVSVIDENDKLIEEDYLFSQGYDSKSMQFDDITGELLRFNFIPAISVLLKADALKRTGRYDESLSFEDLDMWLRISVLFKIAYLPGVTAFYRRNKQSLMHESGNALKIYASLLDCREKFRGLKPQWDKIINKGIVQIAPTLYRYKHPKGKYWLQKRLKYDRHFKSWAYWGLSKFNSRIIWKK